MAKDKQIGFRCKSELRTWLKAKAARDGRTISEWIHRHFEHLREKDHRALDNAKHER